MITRAVEQAHRDCQLTFERYRAARRETAHQSPRGTVETDRQREAIAACQRALRDYDRALHALHAALMSAAST